MKISKAFLRDQCKEVEENNNMGKTRDLFKKIRYTKGTFHAKMGTIKDRNSMLLKCYTQYANEFGKLSSGHRTGKGQFSFQSQRKAMPQNAQTTTTVALISQDSKVMLKVLQDRLQQYVNCEPPDVQAGFRKGRGTRDKIANILWIIEKARRFEKKSTSALSTMPKPLAVWITTNCGKFLRRWEYQTT